jgi:hypothetical protein
MSLVCTKVIGRRVRPISRLLQQLAQLNIVAGRRVGSGYTVWRGAVQQPPSRQVDRQVCSGLGLHVRSCQRVPCSSEGWCGCGDVSEDGQ